MGRSFWSVMAIMLVLFVAATYPSRGEEGWGAGARGKLGMELAVITESSASECSARLQAFVEELEGLFPQLTSVAPIQLLFKKYFPISGCDPAQVLAICKESKYCSEVSAHPSSMVVAFDSRPDDPHSGIYLQFSVNRISGDAQLPFVKVKI